jgi:hypothetical protein
MTGLVAAFGAGVAAGGVHVWSGPDHLAVLSPYAVRHGGRAWWLGVLWGSGHGAGTLVVAAAALALRARFDLHAFAGWGERLVGITLVAVGAWALRQALGAHLHVHAHAHGGAPHVQAHLHSPRASHGRGERVEHRHGHAVAGVGLLHGAAGGAHLWATLPALAMPVPAGVAYLGGYLAGSIAAMALFAGALGGTLERVPHRAAAVHRSALAGAALLSLGVGAWWLLGGGA